jgi:predicted transcriptional regulator
LLKGFASTITQIEYLYFDEAGVFPSQIPTGETLVEDKATLIELTAEIVANYVANNSTSVSDLPALIRATHDALAGIGSPEAAPVETVTKATPAQIRRSITPDALISFEDGKPYKTLRRHLTVRGLTAEAYREKHGLPRDYPMVAPSYSEQRSSLAKSLGLGQNRRSTTTKGADVAETVSEAPKKGAGRKKAPVASKATAKGRSRKKVAEPA